MFIIVCISFVHVFGVAAMLLGMRNAPFGIQDEEGFHLAGNATPAKSPTRYRLPRQFMRPPR